MTRRSFLGMGLRGVGGLALASAGLAGGLALSPSPARAAYVPTDYFKTWREDFPKELVDENDPNTFVMARLKFVTRSAVYGQWDAHPEADENLAAYLRQATNIRVSNKPWADRVVSIDDAAEMYKRPFLFMTGEGKFVFSPEEAVSFREYFRRGGFLYVDDCVANGAGDFLYQTMVTEIQKILPGHQLIPVPLDHEIYHCFYDFPGGAPHCQGQRHPGMGLFLRNRLVCFLTSGDLHCGWMGFWKDSNPHLTDECFKMGVNIILYALTH